MWMLQSGTDYSSLLEAIKIMHLTDGHDILT